MEKWEYCFADLWEFATDEAVRTTLNKYGTEGWELVSIHESKQCYFRAYFKRPKQ